MIRTAPSVSGWTTGGGHKTLRKSTRSVIVLAFASLLALAIACRTETIDEVPVVKEVEVPVEKIIEVEKEVIKEVIVEVFVEKIVEKIVTERVEVPVEVEKSSKTLSQRRLKFPSR